MARDKAGEAAQSRGNGMNDTDNEGLAGMAREHREKSFAVEIVPTRTPWLYKVEHEVRVTHNGFQWQAICFSAAELEKLHAVIGEHLKGRPLSSRAVDVPPVMRSSERLEKLVDQLPSKLDADWDGTNHYELHDSRGEKYFWLDVEDGIGGCETEEGKRLGLVLDIIEELSRLKGERG